MKKNPHWGLVAATTRYQKLLERIPHLAWLMTGASDMWAGRGEIIIVNQRWCEYMGPIPADSHPCIFEEILCAAECDRFLDCWQAAIRLQESLDIKLQLKNISGDWEWFQIKLEPDRDAWGQTIWIGTAVELGGAAALHRKNLSVQFIEALLSHAADGIVACDTDGHLVLFNRAAQIFHGLPPEPIEPEDWANYYDLYNSDGTRLLTKSEIPLFRAWQGAAVVDQEMMIKSSQGGERSLLASGDAIYSPTGEKLGAVVLMRDITAFKQAEIERCRVQLYNERLSTAIRLAKAAAWHWDLGTQKIFWTTEFETLFDYEPGSKQQLYNEWLDRVHPDDREQVQAKLQATINHNLSEFRCEYRIIWQDGQIRWIDAIGELYPKAAVNPQWISGLVYDITDRKQLELLSQTQATELQRLNNSLILTQQSLKERNEGLDRFVYIAAHDLKAPLRAIANLSEWIEEDLSSQTPAVSQKQLQLLRQRVNRMTALIDGLLRYSRLGRQELELETVDVSQLLSETIDSLSPPPSFKIEILSSLPIFDTKRILLGQIFANLLGNAIKHHERVDGRIEISVADLGDRYQFSIADDGPGIPAGEAHQRIFEIFQMVQPRSSNENTGIGLALVKKIVEDEGGQIWLDNQHIPGARFCFTWLKTVR